MKQIKAVCLFWNIEFYFGWYLKSEDPLHFYLGNQFAHSVKNCSSSTFILNNFVP